MSPAQYRGRVVELYEVLLCVGMLSASLGDAAFQSLPSNWRWMVGVPALPALLMTRECCWQGFEGSPAGRLRLCGRLPAGVSALLLVKSVW